MLSLGEEDDNNESGEDEEGPETNEIQIGGLNTTDFRFSAYKGFTGCLSSEHLRSKIQ